MENILIIGLATWRISAIVSREKIFYFFRHWLGEVEYPDGSKSQPDKFFINLVTCIYCLSVWVAVGLFILYQFVPEIVYMFAAAAVAAGFERKVYG